MAFSLTISTSQLDKPILQSLTSTGVANALHQDGYTVRSVDGREFQYVQFDSSGVAAVAGAPAVVALTSTDTAYRLVTADVSDASLTRAGAFLSILTDTYFGWIQTKGLLVDAPCTDGAGTDVGADDALGATADSLWTKITVGGTTDTSAVAVAAGSGGYANIMLV